MMFVRNNFVRGFVNGTVGEVVGFDEDGFPIVKTLRGALIAARPETWRVGEDNETLASLSQVPLRLAWAITIHKSQGMSLDCAEIDLSRSFEFGMGYVALSRVRSLAGIRLLGINHLALRVDEKVLALDGKLREYSKKDLLWFQALKPKEKKKITEGFLNQKKKSLF